MPLPDDQFSTTMKDIKSSKIVNMFKNTLILEVFLILLYLNWNFAELMIRLPFSSQ